MTNTTAYQRGAGARFPGRIARVRFAGILRGHNAESRGHLPAGAAPRGPGVDELPPKIQDKCYLRLERLREMGHVLRRPEADFLRDGIHEFRVSHGAFVTGYGTSSTGPPTRRSGAALLRNRCSRRRRSIAR